MKLFIDTETTGLVNFALPEDNPEQPRLVQIGMLLCTDEGRVVRSYSGIIKPIGFEIPEYVAKIHGITTEFALKVGVNLQCMLEEILVPMFAECDTVIAHNIKFDMPVILSELARKAGLYMVHKRERFCTMLSTTNICRIPKKNGYKWPKLSEAYMHFFGEELKDAHDALTDVTACKRIYFEGLKMREKLHADKVQDKFYAMKQAAGYEVLENGESLTPNK